MYRLKLSKYFRHPPEDGRGAVSKSAHALCGSKGTSHPNSGLVHEHIYSFAHASLPLTRKFLLHLKAPARCARPLPVCARTARGPRRATEKPGLRPQVRLRGDRSSEETALCVLRDIWGPAGGTRGLGLPVWTSPLPPSEKCPGNSRGPGYSSPPVCTVLTPNFSNF